MYARSEKLRHHASEIELAIEMKENPHFLAARWGYVLVDKYEDIPRPEVSTFLGASSTIPMIHFQWHDWILVGERYLVEAKPREATLCNFRRYSWGWSLDPRKSARKGHGFGIGPTYANGETGGITPNNVNDVIRDTLIMALGAAPVPPELIFSQRTRSMLDELLKDALDNASEHARVPLARPAYSSSEVTVKQEWHYTPKGDNTGSTPA